MKKIFFVVVALFTISTVCAYAEEYSVEVILEEEKAPSYTYALDTYNDLTKVESILWPAKLEDGKYQVNITRKDDGLYKIDGTDFYIKTKYCYEYCYSEEVILVVYTGYNYSYGRVIFID